MHRWQSILTISSCTLLLWSCSPQFRKDDWPSCLPLNIVPTAVVSADLVSSRVTGDVIKKMTVQEKLRELNAHCRNGKLVDGAGREIYFYQLTGCWGMPPPDHDEILQKQAEELDTLRKRYTVIEMTCNPSGMPRP